MMTQLLPGTAEVSKLSVSRQYRLKGKTLRGSRLNRSPFHLAGNSDAGLSNKSATKAFQCQGTKQVIIPVISTPGTDLLS